MGRRPKSGAAKIADILAKFNIETPEPIRVPENDYHSDDALTAFVGAPAAFQANRCLECKKPFAHNQRIRHGSRVGYCCDVCRAESFEKSTGIKWHAVEIGKEPWDGDPPLIITPLQFKWLQSLNEWFVKNQTVLEIQGPEPEELPDPTEKSNPTNLEENLFGFDENADRVFEPANQYLGVFQTNLPTSHAPLVQTQTISEDDPFGF
jgi:hypothetical protein